MAEVGRFFVTLTSRFDDKGILKAEGTFKKAQKAGFVAFAAIGAAIGLAVKEAAAFQEEMSFVATMLNTVGKQLLPTMERELRGLAVEFGESTKTLSRGLFDILSAGVDASDAMDVLTVSVKAAKAGFVETALTADAITTVLNAYGKSAEEAGDASDFLFSIINRGKTTMEELGPVMGRVLPLANALGVSMEDIGASLATMTKAGLQTREAVTSLRAIINSMLTPTEDLKTLMKEWGFETGTAALENLGLLGIIKKIGAVDKERLPTLFANVRALSGLAIVLNDLEGLEEDRLFILNRTGLTEKNLAERTNDLNFQLGRMREIFKQLLVEVGNNLLPQIIELTTAFTENAGEIDKWSGTISDAVSLGVQAVKVLGVAFENLGKGIADMAFLMVAVFQKNILNIGIGLKNMAEGGFEAFKRLKNVAVETFEKTKEVSGRAVKGIREVTKAVEDTGIATDDTAEKIVELGSTLQSAVGDITGSFANLFETMIIGAGEGEDAMEQFFNGIKQAFLDLVTTMVAKAAIFGLLSLIPGVGAGLGSLKSFIGLIPSAAGTTSASSLPPIPGEGAGGGLSPVSQSNNVTGGAMSIHINGPVDKDNIDMIAEKLEKAVRNGEQDRLAKTIKEVGTRLDGEASV